MTRGKANKPCGASHYRATLSAADVYTIRERYRPYAFGAQKCADLVGCGIKAAQSVISGETWWHLSLEGRTMMPPQEKT